MTGSGQCSCTRQLSSLPIRDVDLEIPQSGLIWGDTLMRLLVENDGDIGGLLHCVG
jgi:hypothetical protein